MIHHSISIIVITILASVLADPVFDDGFNQQMCDFSDMILDRSLNYSQSCSNLVTIITSAENRSELQFLRYDVLKREFIVICQALDRRLITPGPCYDLDKMAVIYEDLFKLAYGENGVEDAQTATKWINKLLMAYKLRCSPQSPFTDYDSLECGLLQFIVTLIPRATHRSHVNLDLAILLRELLLNRPDLSSCNQDRFFKFIDQNTRVEKRLVEFINQMSPDQIESFQVRHTVMNYVRRYKSDIGWSFAAKIMFLLCAENVDLPNSYTIQDQDQIKKISEQKDKLVQTICSYSLPYLQQIVISEWARYYQGNRQSVVRCSNPDSVLIRFAYYQWGKDCSFFDLINCCQDWVEDVVLAVLRQRLLRCIAHSVLNREHAHKSEPESTLKLVEDLIKIGLGNAFHIGEGYILLATQLAVSGKGVIPQPRIRNAIKRGFQIGGHFHHSPQDREYISEMEKRMMSKII